MSQKAFYFFLLQENEINFSSSTYTEKSKRRKLSRFTYFCCLETCLKRLCFVCWFTSFYFLFFPSLGSILCFEMCHNFSFALALNRCMCGITDDSMKHHKICTSIPTRTRHSRTRLRVLRVEDEQQKVSPTYGDIFLICDINFICQKMTTKLKNRNLFLLAFGVCSSV